MWGTVGSGLTPRSILDRRRSGFPVLSGFIAGKPVQDLMFITSASILLLSQPMKEIGLP